MGIDNFLWDPTSAKPGSSPPLDAPPLKTSTHSTPEIFIWSFFPEGLVLRTSEPHLVDIIIWFNVSRRPLSSFSGSNKIIDREMSLTVKCQRFKWIVMSRPIYRIPARYSPPASWKVCKGRWWSAQGSARYKNAKKNQFLFIASSHFFSENWKTG